MNEKSSLSGYVKHVSYQLMAGQRETNTSLEVKATIIKNDEQCIVANKETLGKRKT